MPTERSIDSTEAPASSTDYYSASPEKEFPSRTDGSSRSSSSPVCAVSGAHCPWNDCCFPDGLFPRPRAVAVVRRYAADAGHPGPGWWNAMNCASWIRRVADFLSVGVPCVDLPTPSPPTPASAIPAGGDSSAPRTVGRCAIHATPSTRATHLLVARPAAGGQRRACAMQRGAHFRAPSIPCGTNPSPRGNPG